MVRARLLELRERDFVLAARNMDAGTAHLVWRHGLPNTLDLLAVMAVNFVGDGLRDAFDPRSELT